MKHSTLSPLTAVVVMACIVSLTLLAWDGAVNGDAVVALLSAIVGGVLHASGSRSGAQAVTDPPPDA